MKKSNRHIGQLVYALCLLLASCSSEEEQLICEPLGEEMVALAPPAGPGVRPIYPWEASFVGEHPRITKDFFRCKGCSLNPVKGELVDCDGGHHGLPLMGGEEGVCPILIELLNEVQEKTGKRVVITCGHRCPQHNSYSDPSEFNSTSKHMVGAEVDFYVQGMEEQPEEVVALILEHFDGPFQRYHKENTNVSTPPWYNREIFVKLYGQDEGRDFDNRHPYPYIGIQVRAVPYSWPAAHRNYRR